MNEKRLPFTKAQIERIIAQHPTPFHIYDARAIRENARRFLKAFAWAPGFKEYFAVKACPTPAIVRMLKELGCGADCSSLAELVLSERVGVTGEDVMFTSNDTPAGEYRKARELGGIINLDDISHIEFLKEHAGIPEVICIRYNPGPRRAGSNVIIGNPEEAKYGFTHEQVFEGYARLRDLGVKRFGLHSFIISNDIDRSHYLETAKMLFQLAAEVKEATGVRIEFVNLSGGLGIPYRPDQEAVDVEALGREIRDAYESLVRPAGLHPMKIFSECGRYITGPYGYLVSTVLHKKDIYRQYVGLDASMADLMRPAIYGAYHHITVLGKEDAPKTRVYDVTGSLCENNDKFAVARELPEIAVGDVVAIHDAGAHGHAMGFNYNGKLRSAELLLEEDGSVRLIRRAETLDDYFATAVW
ncbi:MAG: diaminopimelate decarboxylase [Acidobacteriota bacterium]|jgi:diaminopimelate decarboxylase|nr:diaminopimelate decarboxylase [Acidobacteriota bacterium]